ncbi:MAG: glyoxalase [Chloroflexi bacterium]|nr:glyoxalase [Chloroflexota bacterium]
MPTRIALITLLTDNLAEMVTFYRDALHFNVRNDHGGNVEFDSEGVRFALCERRILHELTANDGYAQPADGHAFELAFQYGSRDEVNAAYKGITAKGARAISAPREMPWGQYTGFFADPDGNIHEVYCDPQDES